MRGLYIRSAPNWLNFALMIVFPLLIALALTYLRPGAGIALALLATAIYIWVNLALFVNTSHLGRPGPRRDLDGARDAVRRVYRILYEGAQRAHGDGTSSGCTSARRSSSDILEQDDPRARSRSRARRSRRRSSTATSAASRRCRETMTPEEIYAQLNEYFSKRCATSSSNTADTWTSSSATASWPSSRRRTKRPTTRSTP